MWLFAILVVVPIIEIALFIQVGGWIGLWPTIAIVIATALTGSFLLRTQGVQTMSRLKQSMATGENPMNQIAHGALILVSAVLLLTPGFFTDGFGLLLLFPPFRKWLIASGASRITSKMFVATGAAPHQQQPRHPGHHSPSDVFDAEFSVVDEPANDNPGNSGWTKKPD